MFITVLWFELPCLLATARSQYDQQQLTGVSNIDAPVLLEASRLPNLRFGNTDGSINLSNGAGATCIFMGHACYCVQQKIGFKNKGSMGCY